MWYLQNVVTLIMLSVDQIRVLFCQPYTIYFAVIMFILSIKKAKGYLLSSFVVTQVFCSCVFLIIIIFVWVWFSGGFFFLFYLDYIFLGHRHSQLFGSLSFPLTSFPTHFHSCTVWCWREYKMQENSVLCFSHFEDILDHKAVRTPMSKAE